MAEPVAHAPQLIAAPGAAAAIERLPTGVTAFVGRTLRGPVNEATAITSFAEFQQRFGGLWQPSMLSYAVEQFFDSGGRCALIVRAVNGGRCATLDLPAGAGWLRLRGLEPGTREYLRASVDHDGVDSSDLQRFNLVVQRVRMPGTEQIEEQEIHRRLSVNAADDRYAGDVLAQSRLVRQLDEAPAQRPDRTPGLVPGALVGYVDSNPDGDDGDELSDYDLIGSAEHRTGLFALEGAPHFDLLCLPPHGRERDVGLPALLVATRLCRSRQAMLIADPPVEWRDADSAIAGLRHWPLQSHDVCMYFPRVLAQDRLRGRSECFASCGAAAGLLARGDAENPVWGAAAGDAPLLRAGLRPAVDLTELQRLQLAREGVNTLLSVRASRQPAISNYTLLPEAGSRPELRYLAVRRLALFVAASIRAGTRWALLAGSGPATWERLHGQVAAFLEALDQQGAFVGGTAADSYFVVCDERLNPATPGAAGTTVRLLYGFAVLRPGEFQAWLLTHRPAGSEIQAVSVNRLYTAGARVAAEIETALLRGLDERQGDD